MDVNIYDDTRLQGDFVFPQSTTRVQFQAFIHIKSQKRPLGKPADTMALALADAIHERKLMRINPAPMSIEQIITVETRQVVIGPKEIVNFLNY